MRNLFSVIFNFKNVISTLLIAILLFLGLLFLLFITRTKQPTKSIPTVILNILPAPTLTPTPEFEQATVESTEALVDTRSYPFKVGDYVQVTGTAGDGLRLRAQPGLESEVKYLASEGEVLVIKDGPRQESDYNWWLIEAPIDQTVSGWAVGNFLVLIESP